MHREKIYRRTDRTFAILLIAESLGCAAWALAFFPRAEARALGTLGALIVTPPLLLAHFRSGRATTRHAVAVAQMLMSALYIHLSSGRIETHFLFFGSLAFLGFYRDWRVLLSASAVVAADNYLRGRFYPLSIYGVPHAESWRWLEHTAWVLSEDFFLVLACFQNLREMQEIATRRAQLENVASHLEEAIAARDNFLSICSHELKTPLTSMKLQAQMGQRALANQTAQPFRLDLVQKLYQGTEKQVNRLASLVENMLDVSRIGTGKLDLKLESVDLKALVEDVLQRHGPQLLDAGCSVTLELEEGIWARCDHFRIEQVVINLVTNASKYAYGRPVLIRLSSDGGVARLVVKDEGMGIPKDQHERIFHRFERLGSPNGVSGLGLGLYISKNIIDQHEGRIVLESEPGAGATFSVELMCTEPAPPKAGPPGLSSSRADEASTLTPGKLDSSA